MVSFDLQPKSKLFAQKILYFLTKPFLTRHLDYLYDFFCKNAEPHQTKSSVDDLPPANPAPVVQGHPGGAAECVT